LNGWVWPASKDQVLVNRWTEFFNGFGGQYFDKAGKCMMNSPDGIAALEFMVSLVKDEITPLDALSWKEEEAQVSFVGGKAIFHTGRQDLTFWLDDPERSEIVEKWGLIPMPAAPQGKHAGFFEGWGFGINKYSDNPEAAAKVLEVMFDFEVQKQFNLSQGPIQGHVDIYTDAEVIENNPNTPLINTIADTAVPAIPSPHYADISTVFQEEIHLALIGIKPAEQALNDACQQIDALR
jgi:multiple sugar transport system substrate-binding protein